MSIKNNITSLQNLLEQVNALPEASNSENLDAEIATQTTLLSEQDVKIAELAQVLAGKASGGSSGSCIETCTGTLRFEAPATGIIYYINSNLDLDSINVSASGVTFSPLKNSILYITGWSSHSYSSENAQQLNYVTATAAYFVTGDFTLTFTQ